MSFFVNTNTGIRTIEHCECAGEYMEIPAGNMIKYKDVIYECVYTPGGGKYDNSINACDICDLESYDIRYPHELCTRMACSVLMRSDCRSVYFKKVK